MNPLGILGLAGMMGGQMGGQSAIGEYMSHYGQGSLGGYANPGGAAQGGLLALGGPKAPLPVQNYPSYGPRTNHQAPLPVQQYPIAPQRQQHIAPPPALRFSYPPRSTHYEPGG